MQECSHLAGQAPIFRQDKDKLETTAHNFYKLKSAQ